MTGMPMARAWSRDGGSAYTLYNGLESHAFVHALDTTKRSARCIDLPWRGDGQNGLERVRMAVGAGRCARPVAAGRRRPGADRHADVRRRGAARPSVTAR